MNPSLNLTAFTTPLALSVQGFVGLKCNVAKTTCRSRAEATMMVSAAPKIATPERTTVVAQPKVERETKQPDMYRLYIYNDPINRRERVVDILLKTCNGLTFSRAYAAMQEAHENGRGLVLIIAQEIAEHYCACINSAGVLSTIEPDK